ELGERVLDDRRRRLGRPAAGELPLRCERDAGDARAAKAGCFADEDESRVQLLLEVAHQSLAALLCAFAVAVEVERRPDLRGGELSHELLRRHCVTMLMRVRACVGAFAALCLGVWAATASAAGTPQGIQSNAAFAG